MEIQNLNENHISACADLYVETFNAEPWNDKWSKETAYKRLVDIYNTPGFFGIVAYEGPRLIAAILGCTEQWYEGYMYNLKEMFVSNEMRGQGIGSKLICEFENQLRQKGINSICLFTAKGDMTEKFYKNNGFDGLNDMQMMIKDI